MNRRLWFIVTAVLFGIGCLLTVQNGREARSKADQIVASDKAGSATTTAQAALATYVQTHMGASVSYTLTGSYNRALANAQVQAASASQNSNAQIYAAAQAACSGHTDSITQARCNQAYLDSHLSTAPAATPVPAPSPTSFQHTLTAPLFTPDLAGALFLGALVALVFGVFSRRPRYR